MRCYGGGEGCGDAVIPLRSASSDPSPSANASSMRCVSASILDVRCGVSGLDSGLRFRGASLLANPLLAPYRRVTFVAVREWGLPRPGRGYETG